MKRKKTILLFLRFEKRNINNKVYMKQYPKISVTHFFKKSKGDTEIGYIYYYITIKRRTILKVAMIKHSLTKEEFESGIYKEAMELEEKMIIKVCELYLDDLENGRVNHDIKDLADRNFKAKDEFTNGLNSYISYYYETDLKEIVIDTLKRTSLEAFTKSLETVFDLSMMDNRDKSRLYNAIKQTEKEKKYKLYFKNLKSNDLAIFCLLFNLHYYLWDNHFEHISIIEYMSILRNDLPTILMRNNITETNIIDDYTMIIKKLGINEEYIKTVFLPIIDKVTSTDYQLSITEE